MTAPLLSLLLPALLSAGPDLTGRVVSTSGVPVTGAHVLIDSAEYREGPTPYFPSGYSDRRKRARTDADGRFRIEAVDPDLVFKVLVVADGFRPEFAAKGDPARGPIAVKLAPIDLAQIPANRMIRGVVLDPDGLPLAGARVTPSVLASGESHSGPDPDLHDTLAVTNLKGEFTLTSKSPIDEGDLRVEGDGVAPQIVPRLAPGRGRHRLTTTRGATVTGRVAREGKPVAGAAVGLVQADAKFTTFLGEMTTTTDEGGRFTFAHVRADDDLFVYGLMGTFGDGGAVAARAVRSGGEGTSTDVGLLPVVRGRRIRGQVVIADGKPIPPRARLAASREDVRDARIVELGPDGRFDLDGLPAERYSIQIPSDVYWVSTKNHSSDPGDRSRLTGKVEADIAGLKILMEPMGPLQDRIGFSYGGLTTIQATVGAPAPPPLRRLPPPER